MEQKPTKDFDEICMSISNNITFPLIRSHIKFINIEMQIEKKFYNRQTCQIKYNQISISQVGFLSAKSVCLTYASYDLLVALTSTVVENYLKRRFYVDICKYSNTV